MAKSVFFLEDPELGAIVSGFRISYLFWCNLLLLYGGRKEDTSFLDIGRFFPIMLGEDDFYFGKGDSFFPLRNHLHDRIAFKRTSLFCRRRRSQFMSELILVKWRSGWQLRLGELRFEKTSA